MITYRLGLYQMDPERAKELTEAIKRHKGSCDTVWLTSMGYYPSLEKHIEYAEKWTESAKIFREAGIKVSLQIANTIGHRDWAQLKPEYNDPFMHGMPPTEDDPYIVNFDGTKNMSCFCWRSKQFTEYICSLVKIYAERIKPDRLWLDDDLRAHHHSPTKYGCYCDRCIAEFNKINSTSYSRESLVHMMNYESVELREKYIGFIRDGVYSFVYKVAKACLSVSPDTSFGLEYEHEHNYLGPNDEHILGAMHDASGKSVETRPGGGYYNDKSPWGQFRKTLLLSSANSLLPDYVTEYVAEMENLPGVAFGKTVGGIVNEGTLDLASGCSGLTLTDVQSLHEPMKYYEKIFSAIGDHREYWERLSRVSKENYRGGVSIFLGKKPHLRELSPYEKPIAWDKVLMEEDVNLMRLGVALTYDKRHPSAYLIHHDAVRGLCDEDIKFLLRQPVICDGESLAVLIERGYGEHFALTPHEQDNNTEEFFTDNYINPGYKDIFYNENPYAASPMKRYTFDGIDNRTEVLGVMKNGALLGDGKELGPCTIVTEVISTGAKWAVFGYSIWSDIVSAAKRNEILGALDAINLQPVRLLCDDQIVIIPSVDDSGRCVAVTVASASQSGTDEIELAVRRPRSQSITTFGTRRNSFDIRVKEEREDELLLSISPLTPYETITLFFD